VDEIHFAEQPLDPDREEVEGESRYFGWER
jgi:hypothetical protein